MRKASLDSPKLLTHLRRHAPRQCQSAALFVRAGQISLGRRRTTPLPFTPMSLRSTAIPFSGLSRRVDPSSPRVYATVARPRIEVIWMGTQADPKYAGILEALALRYPRLCKCDTIKVKYVLKCSATEYHATNTRQGTGALQPWREQTTYTDMGLQRRATAYVRTSLRERGGQVF